MRANGPINLFAASSKNYGFDPEPLESGSHIVQTQDHEFHIFAPNNLVHPSKVVRNDPSGWKTNLHASDNQWLAWYFKSYLGGVSMGFTYFSSYFTVPPLPKTKSNVCFFNSLQASYDPKSYNYILQPVLSYGSWMDGTCYDTWLINSVMCPASGNCQWTKQLKTSPGNVIYGTIEQIQGNTNSYKFRVNITDVTAKSEIQSLVYSTSYFAPMALVSFEHNPAGSVKSCDEIPDATSMDFVSNVLKPTSADMWQGSQSEWSCGLGVDIFVYSDDKLSIKL
ncbi:hypothetical protein EON65_38280 [archaeon]|nr:MAG: hypothetical protein EON65_38280 [archaeon]